ncbi:hypothetical protein X975_27240, partial [Stegodyphus mimosarum]
MVAGFQDEIDPEDVAVNIKETVTPDIHDISDHSSDAEKEDHAVDRNKEK